MPSDDTNTPDLAVLYARYSSDLQSAASTDDQLRMCKERAAKEGWPVVDSYVDQAISGASLIRPGIQKLLRDATAGKFTIVLTEALDRLSRDQEDMAHIYKQMRFRGVRIVTLADGDVNPLHIGLKGTMGALFLNDLADKTRRGQRGRVEVGKSAGGNSYGYDVVKTIGENGEPVRGERRINPQQAAIVRRIFLEYAQGLSPRAIAKQLNQEGVPGPRGKGWAPSTINGNRQRGNGILNNERYIGKPVWNRQRFIKNPDTGRRIPRPNPEDQLVRRERPEHRIIDQELWDRVKARQAELDSSRGGKGSQGYWDRRRPRYLLTGLMTCGVCGGGAVTWNKVQGRLRQCPQQGHLQQQADDPPGRARGHHPRGPAAPAHGPGPHGRVLRGVHPPRDRRRLGAQRHARCGQGRTRQGRARPRSPGPGHPRWCTGANRQGPDGPARGS